jgi:hypothetical protein
MLDINTTPSARSSSSAYAVSASAPSMSDSGTLAKKPKRSGWSLASSALCSLTVRVIARDSVSSPKWVRGELIERMPVAMDRRSIIASALCASQAGVGQPPAVIS